MIEVKYNENAQEKEMGQVDMRSLKNVRQIGSTRGKGRLYLEDQVKSYIDRYRSTAKPCAIVLLGKEKWQDGVCYFIDGAMVCEQIQISGNQLEISQLFVKALQEDTEMYFPDSQVLGFYFPVYGHVLDMVTQWDQQPAVYMTQDENEEEVFYIWEHSRFMRQSGYYVYYDENPAMKQFVKDHPAPEKPPVKVRNVSENRKSRFKDILEEAKQARLQEEAKQDRQQQEEPEEPEEKTSIFSSFNGFMYAASAAMVVVILVVGVTLMSNYEKMYELQESLDTIAAAVSGNHVVIASESPQSPVPSAAPDTADPTASVIGQENDGQGDSLADARDHISPSEREETAEETEKVTKTTGPDGKQHQIYTVQEGDTLISISRSKYDTEQAVKDIRELNRFTSENELQIGEKILLP